MKVFCFPGVLGIRSYEVLNILSSWCCVSLQATRGAANMMWNVSKMCSIILSEVSVLTSLAVNDLCRCYVHFIFTVNIQNICWGEKRAEWECVELEVVGGFKHKKNTSFSILFSITVVQCLRKLWKLATSTSLQSHSIKSESANAKITWVFILGDVFSHVGWLDIRLPGWPTPIVDSWLWGKCV